MKVDMRHTTPGENPNFNGFYVYFDASKKRFLAGCRPVIGLDGCFMKGHCKGEILVAIGRDGINWIYPLAQPIVFQEDIATWKWFIEMLMEDLGLLIRGGFGYTFVTNQQKVTIYYFMIS